MAAFFLRHTKQKEMNINEITYDSLPQAVSLLISEVLELKNILVMRQKTVEPVKRSSPIGINDVCILTGKAKPTIYALVRQRIIPCYKTGKKLYFYEEEVLAWINSGKRKTNAEIYEEANKHTSSKRR